MAAASAATTNPVGGKCCCCILVPWAPPYYGGLDLGSEDVSIILHLIIHSLTRDANFSEEFVLSQEKDSSNAEA